MSANAWRARRSSTSNAEGARGDARADRYVKRSTARLPWAHLYAPRTRRERRRLHK